MTKCLLTLSNWIQKFLQGILLIIGTLLKNHTAQLLLEILRDFLSLTMIVVFLIASTQFLQNSMIYPQKLSSMPVNMYVIYMVMPVSFALMALQKLTNMVVRIGNIVKPDALENTVDKGGQAK